MSPKELTKLYYSISEVSKMCGLSKSTLRYWESEFAILKPKKNRHGERAYTKKDIEVVFRIFTLVKERGFTIEGAKKEISQRKTTKKPKNTEAVIQKLVAVKAKMKNLLKDLEGENE